MKNEVGGAITWSLKSLNVVNNYMFKILWSSKYKAIHWVTTGWNIDHRRWSKRCPTLVGPLLKKYQRASAGGGKGALVPLCLKFSLLGSLRGLGSLSVACSGLCNPLPPPSSEQPKCIASSKGISADTHGSTKHTLGTCFGNGGSLKGSDYYVARAREPYPDLYSYGTGQ